MTTQRQYIPAANAVTHGALSIASAIADAIGTVRQSGERESNTMDVYIYEADIICAECGEIIRKELTPSDDSNDYPQGPYSDGGGEADIPQHCGACHVFLKNPLTKDGVEYVREALLDWHQGECVQEWASFYGIELE